MLPFSLYMVNANKTSDVLTRLIRSIERLPNEFSQESFHPASSKMGTSLYVVSSSTAIWYDSKSASFHITCIEHESNIMINVQNVYDRDVNGLIFSFTHNIPEAIKDDGTSLFNKRVYIRYNNSTTHRSRYNPSTHKELDAMLDKLAILADCMGEWELFMAANGGSKEKPLELADDTVYDNLVKGI